MSWRWLLEPPTVTAAAVAVVHAIGDRTSFRVTTDSQRRRRERQLRAAYFYAGLLVVVASLSGPMDSWSDRWFWVHMGQHLLLTTVAAPLIAMGAPWLAFWRVVGHPARVALTRSVGHRPGWAWLRTAARGLGSPLGAWLAFMVTLFAWHVPAAFDLTLRNAAVHDVEHLSFVATAVLFWIQVVDSPPLRRRLEYPQRVAFLTLASIAGWLLALAIALPRHSLYPAYAVQQGAHGMTALVDQQLAGGMMWVPGSIAFGIGVFHAIYRWMDERTEITVPAQLRRRPVAVP